MMSRRSRRRRAASASRRDGKLPICTNCSGRPRTSAVSTMRTGDKPKRAATSCTEDAASWARFVSRKTPTCKQNRGANGEGVRRDVICRRTSRRCIGNGLICSVVGQCRLFRRPLRFVAFEIVDRRAVVICRVSGTVLLQPNRTEHCRRPTDGFRIGRPYCTLHFGFRSNEVTCLIRTQTSDIRCLTLLLKIAGMHDLNRRDVSGFVFSRFICGRRVAESGCGLSVGTTRTH